MNLRELFSPGLRSLLRTSVNSDKKEKKNDDTHTNDNWLFFGVQQQSDWISVTLRASTVRHLFFFFFFFSIELDGFCTSQFFSIIFSSNQKTFTLLTEKSVCVSRKWFNAYNFMRLIEVFCIRFKWQLRLMHIWSSVDGCELCDYQNSINNDCCCSRWKCCIMKMLSMNEFWWMKCLPAEMIDLKDKDI